MLFNMAVADSYAIAFEFVDHSEDRPNNLATFHQHPTYVELPAGSYTDDTQRAIANALTILIDQDPFNPAAYVRRYQSVYAADPRQGYSRRYQKFLEENIQTSPARFMTLLHRRSTNGALMGVAPLGFLPSVGEVKLATTIQVITTHHPAASPWAQAIALAAHFLLRGGSRSDLLSYLGEHVDWADDIQFSRLTSDHGDKVSMSADDTASAIITELMKHDRQSEILRSCVARGGDTDSVAAGAIALASCTNEIACDLPPALTEAFANRKTRLELKALDRKLRDHFLI